MINGIVITPFDAAAILIILAALLGYLNHRSIGLPPSIALTVMGAIAASARVRRSIDNGLPIHASLHQASTLNQISASV